MLSRSFIDLVSNKNIIIASYKMILRQCIRMGWSPKYGVSLQAPFGTPYRCTWFINDHTLNNITSGYVSDNINDPALHTLLYVVKHNCYQSDPENSDLLFNIPIGIFYSTNLVSHKLLVGKSMKTRTEWFSN